MALDSSGLPAADAPVPPADSPAPDDGTQAGNSPAPPQPVEDNPRVIAAQAALTRKSQEAAELRRERDELLAAREAPDDEDEEAEPAPARRSTREPTAAERAALARAAAAEQTVAEQIYGTNVVDAYDEWLPMWNGTTTKADEITALLAFADKIRGAAPQAPAPAADAAAAPPARAEAVAPRVDLNRPDAAPDLDLDPTKFEDGQNGGAKGFFLKQLEKITG